MMNKKRSSTFELSKYIFLLPLIIFSAAAFTVTKADAKIAEVVQFTERTHVADIPFQPVTPIVDTLKKEKSTKDTSQRRLTMVTDSLAKGSIVILSATKKGEGTIVLTSDSSLKSRSGAVPAIPSGASVGRISFLSKSINGKEPLILVDGKKMVGGFELSAINPNDIESISVSKDAAAIMKHGEEGISGVVEIKLKKDRSTTESDNKEKTEPKIEKTGASAPLESFSVPAGRESNLLFFTGRAVKQSSQTQKDDVVSIVAHGVEKATGKVVTVHYADDQVQKALFEGQEIRIKARKQDGSEVKATDNDDKVIIINAVGRKTN